MNSDPHRFFSGTFHRITNPLNRRHGDIFCTRSHSTESIAVNRMVKDYQKSTIFANKSSIAANEYPNSVRASPKRFDNTQSRLFGGDQEASPRRINDTYRSNISFDGGRSVAENGSANHSNGNQQPPRTPKKTISVLERNPITGEVKPPTKLLANGHVVYVENYNAMPNGDLSNGHA